MNSFGLKVVDFFSGGLVSKLTKEAAVVVREQSRYGDLSLAGRVNVLFQRMDWSGPACSFFGGIVKAFRQHVTIKVLNKVEAQEKNKLFPDLMEAAATATKVEALVTRSEFNLFSKRDLGLAFKAVRSEQAEQLKGLSSWGVFVFNARNVLMGNHPAKECIAELEQMNPDRLEAILQRVENGEAGGRHAGPLVRAYLMHQANPIPKHALSDRMAQALHRFGKAEMGMELTVSAMLNRYTDVNGMKKHCQEQLMNRLKRYAEQEDIIDSDCEQHALSNQLSFITQQKSRTLQTKTAAGLNEEIEQIKNEPEFCRLLKVALVEGVDGANPAMNKLFRVEGAAPVFVNIAHPKQIHVEKVHEQLVKVTHRHEAPFVSMEQMAVHNEKPQSDLRCVIEHTYTIERSNKTEGRWTVTAVDCAPLRVQRTAPKKAPETGPNNPYDPVQHSGRAFTRNSQGQLVLV